MPETLDELFRSPVAAKYLTMSKQTLDLWRCQGRGPKFLKIGRAVVYRRADLDAWLREQVRQSTKEYNLTPYAGELMTT